MQDDFIPEPIPEKTDANCAGSGGDGSGKKTRIGSGNHDDKHKKHPTTIRRSGSGGGGPSNTTRIAAENPDERPKKVKIDQNLTVKELAEALNIRDVAVIKHLFMKGLMRTVHQIVKVEDARQLAIDLGYELIDSESPETE